MPSQNSQRLRHNAAQRKYYEAHLDEQRSKARQRAQRDRKVQTPEQAEARKQRHREAQARYRAQNKLVLKVKSWQYRHDKKWAKTKARDDAEYDALMGMETHGQPL